MLLSFIIPAVISNPPTTKKITWKIYFHYRNGIRLEKMKISLDTVAWTFTKTEKSVSDSRRESRLHCVNLTINKSNLKDKKNLPRIEAVESALWIKVTVACADVMVLGIYLRFFRSPYRPIPWCGGRLHYHGKIRHVEDVGRWKERASEWATVSPRSWTPSYIKLDVGIRLSRELHGVVFPRGMMYSSRNCW